MLSVIVGVALTALLGGLLAPLVKDEMDRRRERLDWSVQLVEVLATGLWAYWKFALRVAYYGRLGDRGADDYNVALQRWDSDDGWKLGLDIQVQVSRSKRLLPDAAQQAVDDAQREVVDHLDTEIERLRMSGNQDDWGAFYDALMKGRRDDIDRLLVRVTDDLKLVRPARRPRLRPPRGHPGVADIRRGSELPSGESAEPEGAKRSIHAARRPPRRRVERTQQRRRNCSACDERPSPPRVDFLAEAVSIPARTREFYRHAPHARPI